MSPDPAGSLPTLLSVNVGRPTDHTWGGGTMNTAIWKLPVHGPQRVRRLNIDGDDQSDKVGHGGEHRAVLVYQIECYTYWQRELGRDDFSYGQFGENFTVTGLSDDDVHVGDRYRIGTAVFEVTQPRVTCYKLGARMGVPSMAALLVAHHRPGFYFRVLEEGDVCAGDAIERIYRPTESLSVAAIDALLYLPDRDPHDLRRAIQLAALSAGWRDSFVDLLAKAQRPAMPQWNGFQPLTVTDVREETPEVRSFTLHAASGGTLPRFSPGQYLTIRVPAAQDSPPVVRTYSLSSSPAGGQYRISVKREDSGLVSGWLHAHLAPGFTVQAAQPRGEFALADSARPVLFASAGIGVTPLLAMLHSLAGQHSARPVIWLQVARSPALRPFGSEVAGLLASLPAAAAHIFYTGDVDDENHCAASEHIHRGRPDSAALRAINLPSDADAYVCGPAGFMRSMSAMITDLGVASDRIFTEAFGPSAAPGAGVLPHLPPGPSGNGATITFSRSGLEVSFADRYGSLLELAEACDVPVHWSCRTGVCHNCITPLVSGTVAYRPAPLDPPGGEQVLLCCATPAEDLVLDA